MAGREAPEVQFPRIRSSAATRFFSMRIIGSVFGASASLTIISLLNSFQEADNRCRWEYWCEFSSLWLHASQIVIKFSTRRVVEIFFTLCWKLYKWQGNPCQHSINVNIDFLAFTRKIFACYKAWSWKTIIHNCMVKYSCFKY